jgi:hypothetical protein
VTRLDDTMVAEVKHFLDRLGVLAGPSLRRLVAARRAGPGDRESAQEVAGAVAALLGLGRDWSRPEPWHRAYLRARLLARKEGRSHGAAATDACPGSPTLLAFRRGPAVPTPPAG